MVNKHEYIIYIYYVGKTLHMPKFTRSSAIAEGPRDVLVSRNPELQNISFGN